MVRGPLIHSDVQGCCTNREAMVRNDHSDGPFGSGYLPCSHSGDSFAAFLGGHGWTNHDSIVLEYYLPHLTTTLVIHQRFHHQLQQQLGSAAAQCTGLCWRSPSGLRASHCNTDHVGTQAEIGGESFPSRAVDDVDAATRLCCGFCCFMSPGAYHIAWRNIVCF